MCGGVAVTMRPKNSSDPDLLILILAIGIDPSEGMGIYTITATKKTLKDIFRHYQPFHSYFLTISRKQSGNISNLSWLDFMYKRINIPSRQYAQEFYCLAYARHVPE